MPILQTIPPANLYALANDHDYRNGGPKHICLSDLQVISLSAAEASEIEMKTRGQSQCAAWYEEREKRIQSSMFGRICKLTSRTNKMKLCESMITRHEEINTPAIRYGRKNESIAVQAYESKCKVQTTTSGIFVSQNVSVPRQFTRPHCR